MLKALCRYRAAQTHQHVLLCHSVNTYTFHSRLFIPSVLHHPEKYSGGPKDVELFSVRVRGGNVFTMGAQDKWNKVSHTDQASPPSAINRWKKTFLLCLSLNLLTVITPFKMSFCLVVYWSLAPRFLAFPTCMHTLFLLLVTTETNRWWLGDVSPR